MMNVEVDQVMTDKTVAARGEVIQLRQRRMQAGGAKVPFRERQRRSRSFIDRGESKYTSVAFPNFQVN